MSFLIKHSLFRFIKMQKAVQIKFGQPFFVYNNLKSSSSISTYPEFAVS